MIDAIKKSLSTPEGWCSAIIFITKAIEYFVPASLDSQIDQITSNLTAIIIAGSALFLGMRAGTNPAK